MTTWRQTFIRPSGGNINRPRYYWMWSNQKKSYSWAWERKKKVNDYVTKLEQNNEWNTVIELLLESYSRKNRKNHCLLLDCSCFAGWEHRHRNNCLQDENHEKTHHLFNRKHGHVRSAVCDFLDSCAGTTALYRLLAERCWTFLWARSLNLLCSYSVNSVSSFLS